MFLEHVNLTVVDLDESIRFYTDLFGWKLRWRGTVFSETRDVPAAHVGDDRFYLSLFEAEAPGRRVANYAPAGVNHFGLVVDDLEEMEGRLRKLGREIHKKGDYEPGRRLYFFDANGIEVELVEYGADDLGG